MELLIFLLLVLGGLGLYAFVKCVLGLLGELEERGLEKVALGILLGVALGDGDDCGEDD